MRRTYKAPAAEALLFAPLDLLMASTEDDAGLSGSEGDGSGPWIGDDGVIHLPPVPLG